MSNSIFKSASNDLKNLLAICKLEQQQQTDSSSMFTNARYPLLSDQRIT